MTGCQFNPPPFFSPSPAGLETYFANENDRITYVGDWTTVQAPTVNNLVSLINGPAFSPTLHSTTTTSSFTFPFHGSSINVIGSINIANLSLQNQDPTWKCAVDGIDIVVPNLSSNQENIQTLCSHGGFSDGVHELFVNVTSKGMPFYLDFFEIQPSPDVSLDNSLVLIANTDPAVDFISGWGPIDIRNGTTDPEGLVNVTFIGMEVSNCLGFQSEYNNDAGIQLAWYGYTPFAEPHNASSGEYSVDGRPLDFTSFQLPSLSQSFSSTVFNRLFFTTPVLKMGTHVLSARYTGSPGQTPFTLDYLIVTNGSFSTGFGGNGGNHTLHPVPSTNDSSKNSSHVGSIVGGVVGGVVGIVICSIVLFFWIRFRRGIGRSRGNGRDVIEPFSVQPQFVPQAAPLLAPNRAAGKSRAVPQSSPPNQTVGTSSGSQGASPIQSTTSPPFNSASSSNNLVSPYVIDETISGPRRPLPIAPSTQLIPPRPRRCSIPIGGTANTIAPVQHEDSGIRLLQPVLVEIAVEIPPTYSEQ